MHPTSLLIQVPALPGLNTAPTLEGLSVQASETLNQATIVGSIARQFEAVAVGEWEWFRLDITDQITIVNPVVHWQHERFQFHLLKFDTR